jgi:hypothetical protein
MNTLIIISVAASAALILLAVVVTILDREPIQRRMKMGIDIYLKWPKQSEAEEKAQITGFSVTAGNTGYLREAYHGGPYVTRFLVREAFDDPECEAAIPAKTLKERLPGAVMLAIYREHVVYQEPTRNNVELAEALGKLFGEVKALKGQSASDYAPNAEQLRAAKELIKTRNLPPHVLAFVDFVALAERKEKETGEPCTIIASY